MPARHIVFSHANGFPAGTYRLIFEAWQAAGYSVSAVDKYGHDPAHPVTDNWPHLLEQLLRHADEAARGAPVHFVGHSLGGFLSLMAACKRPGLAASVVMLDSPVVSGWRAGTLRFAKATGLVGRFSPGRATQHRRFQFPDAQAVRRHYEGRGIFKDWDPRVLDDYVRAGTVDAPEGGLHLAFSREIETAIYNTLPHGIAGWVRSHPPQCPVGFVAGTHSAELRQVGIAATRALAGDRFIWMRGSHLFPMERPADTAQVVLALLEQRAIPSGLEAEAPKRRGVAAAPPAPAVQDAG